MLKNLKKKQQRHLQKKPQQSKFLDLLVVGLGNPGPKYENTRHNVGFQVIELLSRELGLSFKKKIFQPYQYCKTEFEGNRLVFVKPLTYMNRSGEIFSSLFRSFKMSQENVLVLCDNLDLPPGRSKLKLKGSPAAHNGLKSISSYLDSSEYKRIFIGIGHPGHRDDVKDWVLGSADADEEADYKQAFRNCADAILDISRDKMDRVMNELNRKKTALPNS